MSGIEIEFDLITLFTRCSNEDVGLGKVVIEEGFIKVLSIRKYSSKIGATLEG